MKNVQTSFSEAVIDGALFHFWSFAKFLSGFVLSLFVSLWKKKKKQPWSIKFRDKLQVMSVCGHNPLKVHYVLTSSQEKVCGFEKYNNSVFTTLLPAKTKTT